MCAFAIETLPTNLLVAAHIKPRSKCSTSERKNPNVVMPLCKIGCDDFFEKGYLISKCKGKKLHPKTNDIISSEIMRYFRIL